MNVVMSVNTLHVRIPGLFCGVTRRDQMMAVLHSPHPQNFLSKIMKYGVLELQHI